MLVSPDQPVVSVVPLFQMRYGLTAPTDIGPFPFGRRILIATTGGRFEGEGLEGEVLPGGTDWITAAPNGPISLDADVTLRTGDGVLIHAHWDGLVSAKPAVLPLLLHPKKRGGLDANQYSFRVFMKFTTGSETYAWLNHTFCVGSAKFHEAELSYHVARIA